MNDAFGHPQSIVVLGGTSDIARRSLQRVVPPSCRSVVLAGRDTEGLSVAAAEVRSTGATTVSTVEFDAAEPLSAVTTVERSFAAAGGEVDLVVIAVGRLGDQSKEERDPLATSRMITVNFTWPATALSAVADRMRLQGHGRIIILSSVAGARIRRANFIYGSSKAGLDAYGLGLSEALRPIGVRVQVVRLGFVHTKMTDGLSPAPFAISASQAAEAVAKGLQTDRSVVWAPSTLKGLFIVLRHLPLSISAKTPGIEKWVFGLRSPWPAGQPRAVKRLLAAGSGR